MRVLVPKDWPLARQTPSGTGRWDGLEVVQRPIDACDYLVVLNRPAWPVDVRCRPDAVWTLVLEPANEYYRPLHEGDRDAARVYTSDETRTGSRFHVTYPPLPWQVGRSYDELRATGPPEKLRDVSCIATDKSAFAGHRRRLALLSRLADAVPFDLYGRGFRELDDKWDALAPYRYSIAVENHISDHYWTEKLADCFLAWTMPIYVGARRITDYFPGDALILIEPDDPDAAERIRSAIASDRWRKNLDALEHARSLVLDHWQIFPFLAREIEKAERTEGTTRPPADRIVLATLPRLPPRRRAEFLARRSWTKARRVLAAPLVRRTIGLLRKRTR